MTTKGETMDDYVERHRSAYRVSEVSERIGVHQRTVVDWLNCGRLRGRKVGGTWLIPTTALDELLELDQPA